MEVDYIELTKEIRKRLQRTWIYFFARFGKLTEIQIKAIPKILDRKNLLIVSPTASGKTEAVVSPLIERLLEEDWSPVSILYLAPTRALVNDIYLRLEAPLREIGLKCEYKHMDKPNINYNNLPDFLITTPESLDSLICRHSDIFKNIKAVILDEIHFIDNTYRGDHVRVLLNRLKKISKNFNIYLLSATIAAPEELGKRYIEDFEIVKSEKIRAIDYLIVKSDLELKDVIKSKRIKKILVFCNYRESVERIKQNFSDIFENFTIFVHHGNLDRRFREEAEKSLKDTKLAICIATSTLEVGIDVGDIECVVIYEIPWSLFSLLQRVGRGNRNKDIIFSIGVARNSEEEIFLKKMYDEAKRGLLPKEEYKPDYSVVVQQIFSMLYENSSGLYYDEIFELLKPISDEIIFDKIINHLVAKNFIYQINGKYYLSVSLRDIGEKGKIHSNIPDSLEYEVIEQMSGSAIGKISGFVDKCFVLGGIPLKIISIDEFKKKIYVERIKGKYETAIFERKKNIGAFYKYLPDDLKVQISNIL